MMYEMPSSPSQYPAPSSSNGAAANEERFWIRKNSKPVLYEIRLQHHHPIVCLSVDDLACQPTSTRIRRYGVCPFALVFYPEGPEISVFL